MPRYLAFRYRQTPLAKPILSFVAPAEDIRSWGGVPHKTTDFLGGFQRPLSERFKQIIQFFDEQGNSSPTAIVVAFRPGAVTVTPLELPGGIDKSKLGFKPEWVMVDVPDGPMPNDTVFDLAVKVCAIVKDRIANDTKSEPDSEDDDTEGQEMDGSEPNDEFVPEEGNVLAEWGVDVGKSALREFAERVKDKSAVKAFLEEIALSVTDQELAEADLGKEEAAKDADKVILAERRLRDVLDSLLRPAMIVDGQHRVWGAAESEHEVPFAVCALEDADWKDQVFQFVVINKQARAINSELLASIVNSSLTNREIASLEDQLEAAGISTYETRVLRVLNDDPDSPFRGLVSRGLEEQQKKITFKAAIALAARWSKRMTDRDSWYKTLFRPVIPGENNPEKLATWQTSLWRSYMFAFWNAIRNKFEPEHLWEPGTQLMYRATMEVLQDNFLEAQALVGKPAGDPVEFRELVAAFYDGVPAGFFHTKWKRTELLTDDGRAVLKHALNAMRVPGAKLKSLEKTHPLFTGSPTKKAK